MVGDSMIRSASFWRIKSADAVMNRQWTTTATTHGSAVEHGNIPDYVVRQAAEYLRQLAVRTAGIDLIWADDDLSRTPLVLELSPYYQPNPPKPARYQDWSYKRYKQRPFIKEGYFHQQYVVFREIAGEVLDQGFF